MFGGAAAHSDSHCDSERCDWNVTLSNHWEVQKLVNLFPTRSPSAVNNASTSHFSVFIILSKHQIILWPGVISPVSAQDKTVALNLQHGSPPLYQTLHHSAPFSSHSHKTSPLYSFFLCLCRVSNEAKGRELHSARQPLAKGQSRPVIIHHGDSILYLDMTKTVVRETLILLCCQICYLKYSCMTTGAAGTLHFTSVLLYSVCQSRKLMTEKQKRGGIMKAFSLQINIFWLRIRYTGINMSLRNRLWFSEVLNVTTVKAPSVHMKQLKCRKGSRSRGLLFH